MKTTMINRAPRAKATVLPAALSNRLNLYLGLLAGGLLAAYVALMVTTILLAALQTQLAQNIQNKQMAIGKLETSYYAAIGQMDSTDPHALGYVTPAHVQYVTAASPNGLSFAKN
ncbi:MAG: hypothetical protein JWN90_647 [Parcubacteria group bacterium]|nr:hypothetical protein [Parcubacteria group bacterium]